MKKITNPVSAKTNPNEPNFRAWPPAGATTSDVLCLWSCVCGSFGVQFSTIREHKRLLIAISRAIRDNSRQLALIRDKPPPAQNAPPLLSERCTLSACLGVALGEAGLNAVILQNKPNFGKIKNELNPLSKKKLRRKIPSPATRKTNPIKPNFRAWPPADRTPCTPESHPTLKKLEKGLRDGYNCCNNQRVAFLRRPAGYGGQDSV